MLKNEDLLKILLADDNDEIIKLIVWKNQAKNTADEDERVEIEIREESGINAE